MSVQAPESNVPAVLTAREAGVRCGVSFRTVIRWVERGELQAYRLPGRGDYRIKVSDLKDFAARHGLPDPEGAIEPSPVLNRVLIVDDDPSMARSIQRVLRPAGYETLIASDGFQAGSLLHSFSPALMTLDLRMPGLDGFGVLQFLRDGSPRPSLRVLVISGESDDCLRKAREKGAHDTLAKPFSNEGLRAAVQRLLPLRPSP